MRQLVGELCVICRERIGSEIEGHFCRACGCPVHEGCGRPAEGAATGCSSCGAATVDSEREQALHRKDQRQRTSVSRQMQVLKGVGVFGLVSLLGGLRLLAYLAKNPNSGFAEIVDVGIPLFIGLVGIAGCFVVGFWGMMK
jgi:hypothetical protein